jgi:hypothetical protein
MGKILEGLEFNTFAQFVELLEGLCPHFVFRGVSK